MNITSKTHALAAGAHLSTWRQQYGEKFSSASCQARLFSLFSRRSASLQRL